MSIVSDDQPRTKRCTMCGTELVATADNFYRNKATNDGLRAECKKCRAALKKIYRAEHEEEIAAYRKQYYVDHKEEESASAKRYYEEHQDELKAYAREYYQENKEQYLANGKQNYAENRDEIIAHAKAYYQEHREERLIYAKGYRDEHKDEYAEHNKQYRIKNPDYFKQYNLDNPEVRRGSTRRRRAKKRNAEGTHTDAEVSSLYELQQGLCCYCSEPVKDKLNEPRRTVGAYVEEHIVPLCRERSTDWAWNIVVSCKTCNNNKGKKIPFLEWRPKNLLLNMREYIEEAIQRHGYELRH